MAKTLLRDQPAAENAMIKAASVKLAAHVAQVDKALSARVRAKNPAVVAREIDFDRAVDTSWMFLRRLLELCALAFGHEGLGHLAPERQAQLNLPQLRKLAALAQSLHEQLFAAEGTAFTQASFAIQAESMAAILRIIDEDQLEAGIVEVVGQPLLLALRICQAQYEELVDDRMRRDVGFDDDFRALRARLRWLLDRYKAAIETLYDEDQPKTWVIIEAALRSLILLSAQMARGPQELDPELDDLLGDPEPLDDDDAELENEADADAVEPQEPQETEAAQAEDAAE
jgi:hypothetical protein